MEDIALKMQMHMFMPILMEDIYIQNVILIFRSKIHMESLTLGGENMHVNMMEIYMAKA
jgi:hypothetical protein